MSNHAYYLSNALDPTSLEKVTRKALRYLRRVNADAIVVTGVSGMIVGGAISVKGLLPCVVVRKTVANCHSSYKVEVPWDIDEKSKIVFVDDLVSSGATLRRVIKNLNSVNLTISNEILNYKAEEDVVSVGKTKYKIIDIGP